MPQCLFLPLPGQSYSVPPAYNVSPLGIPTALALLCEQEYALGAGPPGSIDGQYPPNSHCLMPGLRSKCPWLRPEGNVRRLSPEHSTNPPWPPLRSDKYEWSPTSGHSAGNLPSSYIYIIPYLMTNTYYPWTSYFWFSWQWEIPNIIQVWGLNCKWQLRRSKPPREGAYCGYLPH